MQVRDYVIRRLIKLPLVIIAVTIGVFVLSRIGGSRSRSTSSTR